MQAAVYHISVIRPSPQSFGELFPLVSQRIMAADRTVSTFGSGCVGHRYRFLAVGSFGTYQVELGTGMHIMAAQTGDGVLFTGMQIMKIAGSVAEAVLGCFLLRHERLVMTLKTELIHRKTELVFEVGNVRGMAAEAVVFHDRRVDTLQAGLVFVASVTDFGTLVLNPIQTVVALMVAPGYSVAGSTLFISQTAVNERSSDLAAVALGAEFSAYSVNCTLGFGSRNR